jgi:hypothetical protein
MLRNDKLHFVTGHLGLSGDRSDYLRLNMFQVGKQEMGAAGGNNVKVKSVLLKSVSWQL